MSYTITAIKCLKPPMKNYKRSWEMCKKCGIVSYYDYLPHSLSTPIFTIPCFHDFRQHYASISEREGLTRFWKQVNKL